MNNEPRKTQKTQKDGRAVFRALVRLEGRPGDGRQFVEPGELLEMVEADAAVYLAAGLIEATDQAAAEARPFDSALSKGTTPGAAL